MVEVHEDRFRVTGIRGEGVGVVDACRAPPSETVSASPPPIVMCATSSGSRLASSALSERLSMSLPP